MVRKTRAEIVDGGFHVLEVEIVQSADSKAQFGRADSTAPASFTGFFSGEHA